jgi:GT2 family glycosyltransferase
MKIYYRQIFRTDKNIGAGYNEEMELAPDGSWVCFTDGDTCQMITDYGAHLESYISKYHDVGLFTCMTNRVGQGYHVYERQNWNNHDMVFHKRKAAECIGKGQHELTYLTDTDAPLSGHLMLVNKDVWKIVGGFADGCLGVDNDFHRRCLAHGIRVGLMNNFYIYHFYRGHKDYKDVSHLR